MNRNKNFTLVEILVAICIIAILGCMVCPLFVHAQPGGTNTAGFGAHQFNDNLIAPLAPSRTLADQLARGINTGHSVTTTDGTVTNTFSTNYVYSAPPCVIVTPIGPISTTNIVVSVTTSNFIYRASITGVTNNWVAIGQ